MQGKVEVHLVGASEVEGAPGTVGRKQACRWATGGRKWGSGEA